MKISGEIFSYFNIQRANAPQRAFVQKPQMTNPFNQFFNQPAVDTFERTTEPKEAKTLEFRGHKCSTDEFKVKQLYGLPCPCCGKIMLHNNQINNFSRSVVKRSGEDLIDRLDKYSEFYRPVEKEAVEKIKKTAAENPYLPFEQIIQLNAENAKENLENRQIEILTELREASDYFTNRNKAEQYKEFIDSSIELIKSRDNNFFKRKTFIDEYLKMTSDKQVKPSRKKAYKELRKKIYSLPSSHSSTDAFFVKYSRRTPYETAQRLLKPAGATTEHIRPHSKNGEDNTANYLCECNDCNSRRENQDFLPWAAKKPNFETNLQNYLNEVAKKLDEADFEEYSTYVDDIIETVKRESYDRIILTKPEILPEALPETTVHNAKKADKEEIREQKQQKANLLVNDIKEKQDRINYILRRKEELKNDEEYGKYLEYLRLKGKVNNKENALEAANEELKTFRKKIHRKQKSKDKTKPREARVPTPEELEMLEQYKQQASAAREALQKATRTLESYLSTFEEPEALAIRVGDLKSKIDSIDNLEKQADTINKKLAGVMESQRQYEELLKIIEKRTEELWAKESKIDFSNPENKAAAKNYSIITSKLKIIDTVNPTIFRPYYKESRDMSKNFIIEEAKKSLEAQRQELLTNEAAKCVQERIEVRELQNQAKALIEKITSEAQTKQELNKIKEKIKTILAGRTDEELKQEHKEAKEKLQRYEEYKELQHSNETIFNLQIMIDKRTRDLAIITEQINKLN